MARAKTEMEKERERVDRLRAQIAKEQESQALKQASGDEAILTARLKREGDALEERLAALRERGKNIKTEIDQQVEAVSTDTDAQQEAEASGGETK